MSVLPFFFERLRKNVFFDLEQCLAPGASRSVISNPAMWQRAPRPWIDLCLSRLDGALRFSY